MLFQFVWCLVLCKTDGLASFRTISFDGENKCTYYQVDLSNFFFVWSSWSSRTAEYSVLWFCLSRDIILMYKTYQKSCFFSSFVFSYFIMMIEDLRLLWNLAENWFTEESILMWSLIPPPSLNLSLSLLSFLLLPFSNFFSSSLTFSILYSTAWQVLMGFLVYLRPASE